MPVHKIRLRAGWEWLRGTEPARRIDLPAAWQVDPPQESVCLRRRFGRPRADEGQEIALELADVPGLRAVRLNGHSFECRVDEPEQTCIVPVAALEARNLLELDVDLAQAIAAGPDLLWGTIALVITDRDR